MNKYQVQRELDLLYSGLPCSHTIGQLCDEITRIWSLGGMTYDELTSMCLQAINIISRGCMANGRKLG